MQNFALVLDANRKPLNPCPPGTARRLLRYRKAAVYRSYPFTIILKRAIDQPELLPVTFKIDPGAKTTGIALVVGGRAVWAAELEHRGKAIYENLESRRSLRRGRRQRHTRYRAPRFDNRRRGEGWLSPSLMSRLYNIRSWFIKLYQLCNIEQISMELVRFDTQLMQNVEVSGVEYQQGELAGYEVREYLLEKFERKCCYCGKTDIPLEIEHITPKSRGGSNRVSNLCLACRPCNQRKGNQTAAEFGHAGIQALAKKPLKDAAAVNSVRWALWRLFDSTGLPVEVGTGGRTKFNRTKQGYPKAHWIDAACVGQSGQSVKLNKSHQPITIKATGRGKRQMQRVNAYGFPCATAREPIKRRHGFQTGDIVSFVQPAGKYAGSYTGRIIETNKADFAIKPLNQSDIKKISTTNHQSFKIRHRSDGYNYRFSAQQGNRPRRRKSRPVMRLPRNAPLSEYRQLALTL